MYIFKGKSVSCVRTLGILAVPKRIKKRYDMHVLKREEVALAGITKFFFLLVFVKSVTHSLIYPLTCLTKNKSL